MVDLINSRLGELGFSTPDHVGPTRPNAEASSSETPNADSRAKASSAVSNPRTQAATLLAKGEFDQALRILIEILCESPKDWNALYLAGQCCRFLHDYSAAI